MYIHTLHIYVYAHIYRYISIYLSIYLSLSLYIYTYIHTCIYTYIYIYTHIYTHITYTLLHSSAATRGQTASCTLYAACLFARLVLDHTFPHKCYHEQLLSLYI